jgi:hypothetical protein
MKTLIGILLLTIFYDCVAQDDANLAKKAQNPVGDLISLPFQNNTSFGMGEFNRVQNVLNIQPVFPIKLGSNWNLITRTILPIITQPDLTSDTGSNTGIGDINFTAFISPSSPGKLIWGAGPAISIPTASTGIPGFGKWAFGPSVVALTISGPWVAGIIASNVWSFTEDNQDAEVNFFFTQYFVNYNLPSKVYIVSAPIITNNWNSENSSWIVPFGGGIGKIFRLGELPINANLQAYYNVVTPDGGPTWSSRIQIQLMFPKK